MVGRFGLTGRKIQAVHVSDRQRLIFTFSAFKDLVLFLFPIRMSEYYEDCEYSNTLLPSLTGVPLMSRDAVGYGEFPPDPKWPNGAKVALQIVLNYEEGGESSILHGDGGSEHRLSDIIGAEPFPAQRHANMESLYDFGSRAGFWRLHRLLNRKKIPCTVFAVGMALQRNREVARAMIRSGWEVASHGYRWIDYQNIIEAEEMEHIHHAIGVHEDLFGHRPVGMYQGKPNVKTRSLVSRAGFLYDSDSYADDIPYWSTDALSWGARPHLVIPYTLSENDRRFVTSNGFSNGREFSTYLKDHLDYLIKEAKQEGGVGRIMSVGLHCRLSGRAGRASGLEEFLDHAKSYGDDVWICRRDEIAKHWYENFWEEEWGDRPEVILHNMMT